MNYKPIIIVHGEPNSIFLEIFFKSLKFKKIMSPLILISSLKLVKLQMKRLNYNMKIKSIDYKNLNSFKLDNKTINLINVDYKTNTPFKKISKDSSLFINNCFKIAIKIINLGLANKLINGPISKKHFLKKKFPGITEYIGDKTNSKNQVMLIYNDELSVCPLTTHIPIKKVASSIKSVKIIKCVKEINKFYRSKLNKSPKIALLGLNPHCETTDEISEEKREIEPAIHKLNKIKIKISGPFPADTFFLKKNIKKYDVVIGMYHDQVLTPIKTLYKFKAINLTLGLPFIKVTPDHGPNHEMLGKNKSDPSSIFYALNFLKKFK